MVVGEIVTQKDVVIIGAGPGGYHAAVTAAKWGLDVLLVEKARLGGICLHKGCIPSKRFAQAAARLAQRRNDGMFGIIADSPQFSLQKLQQQKRETIRQLEKGIDSLMAANGVEIVRGQAAFLSPRRIGVESRDSYHVFDFKQAIIATGSTFARPLETDSASAVVYDSTNVYEIEQLPEHLLVYGNDSFSFEAAMSFCQFGSKVSLVLPEEASCLPYDSDIRRELLRQCKKHKIVVYENYRIKRCIDQKTNVQVLLEQHGSGKQKRMTVDALYTFSVNRGNTSDLNLEKAGVKCDENGKIPVDRCARTNQKHIYAVGDVTPCGGRAHVAIRQGKVAAAGCSGKRAEFSLDLIPYAVHTQPPFAGVGLTEDEARRAGYRVRSAKFPFQRNSYAAVSGHRAGFVKIISEEDSDVLLGIHLFGAAAVDLAGWAAVTLEMAGRDEDLNAPFYPHPSFGEALLEASEQLKKMAVHVPES